MASELAPLDRGNPCGLSATTEASDNPEQGKSGKRLRLKVSSLRLFLKELQLKMPLREQATDLRDLGVTGLDGQLP